MTSSERKVWNRAIAAAIKVCHEIDGAASGQGHSMTRAKRGASLNPHVHRSGEIQLGAMRCATHIAELRR